MVRPPCDTSKPPDLGGGQDFLLSPGDAAGAKVPYSARRGRVASLALSHCLESDLA